MNILRRFNVHLSQNVRRYIEETHGRASPHGPASPQRHGTPSKMHKQIFSKQARKI